ENQELGHALQIVEDVVEVAGDDADVLPVQGRDEGRVEGIDDFLGDLVALVLEGLQLRHLNPAIVQALAGCDLGEEADRPQQMLRVTVQQLVEPLLLRHEELDDLVTSHASTPQMTPMTSALLFCDVPVIVARAAFPLPCGPRPALTSGHPPMSHASEPTRPGSSVL